MEGGDLLSSDWRLPLAPLGHQGSSSPCSNFHLPLWLPAQPGAGLQVPGAACWAAAFESPEPGAGEGERSGGALRVEGGAREAAEQERACCPLAGWRSSRVDSIVTCSGPAPPHRPAPSPSLACSPAERRRRPDSGRRLRGRRERGRGECGTTGARAGAARLGSGMRS